LTKAQARNFIRQQRSQMSDVVYQRVNQQLYSKLHPFLQHLAPKVVHCFLPILHRREVNTWPIIRWMQKNGMQVVVSRAQLDQATMQHFMLEPNTSFQENAWGIPEPVGDVLVRTEEALIDLILVPLMAFDQRGERVGYGKGYYDRFLAGCRPDTRKVGLSLFPPVSKIEDISPLDIRMDYTVTPAKVWVFTDSADTTSW